MMLQLRSFIIDVLSSLLSKICQHYGGVKQTSTWQRQTPKFTRYVGYGMAASTPVIYQTDPWRLILLTIADIVYVVSSVSFVRRTWL